MINKKDQKVSKLKSEWLILLLGALMILTGHLIYSNPPALRITGSIMIIAALINIYGKNHTNK